MNNSEENAMGLNLAELVDLSRVIYLENATKNEVLDALIETLALSQNVKSKFDLSAGIYEREELMSTGIGLNLGIPHVRIKSVKDLTLAVALVKNGVEDYASLDSSLVKLIFMIVAREDQHAAHLKLLATLSNGLKNEEIRDMLINSTNAEELFHKLGGK